MTVPTPYLHRCTIFLQRSLNLPLLLLRVPTTRLQQPGGPFGHHLLLPLLLEELLLVAQRQGIRNSQQQNARRQHPQAFARVRNGRRSGRHQRRRHGGDARAGLGRDDVAQRGDAVVQRLVDGVGLGSCVVGDFGV